jgi:hypothetical protein
VHDDDDGLVLAPAVECFEPQNTRSGVRLELKSLHLLITP